MNLQAWFAGLAPRERRMVVGGGAAAGVLLLAGGIGWLNAAVGAAEERVARKRADLAWIAQVTPRLGAMPAARPGESLAITVDRLARETGLAQALTGAEPAGPGSLRVRFESASFDALALWMARVQQERGAAVESASVDAREEPGLVDATLVLANP